MFLSVSETVSTDVTYAAVHDDNKLKKNYLFQHDIYFYPLSLKSV
jgi:hypothetical protein